jgi:hypothetical protein
VAVALATTARATYVEIPATTTGWVSKYPSGYDKGYGVLSYAHLFYHGNIFGSAFLKFGLATLPDACLIRSADLNYYQYMHLNAIPTTSLKLIPDPVPPGAEELFSLIELAPTVCPAESSPDGWVSRPFNAGALSALDSCREAGSVSLGIREEGDLGPQGNAYGYDGELPPFLRIEYVGPNESDVQALQVGLTTYPLEAHGKDTALLLLINKGLGTSGPFWAYASLDLMCESTLVGALQVGETTSVTLPLPSSENADTFVTYRLWAACPNDPWQANDTALLTCWTFPANTYAAVGFDKSVFLPPGWIYVNSDHGSERWQRRVDGGVSHSGTGFAACMYEADVRPNDDWLISGPILPRQGDPDSVGFFYRIYQAGRVLKLQVWVMHNQNVADTMLALARLSPSDAAYKRCVASLDEFDGDTIYIGFRFLGAGDSNGVCLDDIWFSRIDTSHVEPPPRDMVRRSDTKLPSLALAPNPALGRSVIIKCYTADGRVSRLTLRDVLGRAVATFSVPSGTTRLDLRGFTAGVYVVTLDGALPLVSRKLVISR